jgi:hypothetical protein
MQLPCPTNSGPLNQRDFLEDNGTFLDELDCEDPKTLAAGLLDFPESARLVI